MEAHFRRALRVLRMVHEFHKRGYQLMRIYPGLSASGGSWRCGVTPRANILRTHGAMIYRDTDQITARYNSAQGNHYFDWRDAEHDTVQQLADRFAERFPDIVSASRGDDWEYAGWYVRMLGFAERQMFPISYADWWGTPRAGYLPVTGNEFESELPMPPPGEADLEEFPR